MIDNTVSRCRRDSTFNIQSIFGCAVKVGPKIYIHGVGTIMFSGRNPKILKTLFPLNIAKIKSAGFIPYINRIGRGWCQAIIIQRCRIFVNPS